MDSAFLPAETAFRYYHAFPASESPKAAVDCRPAHARPRNPGVDFLDSVTKPMEDYSPELSTARKVNLNNEGFF
jgi:hypothetical protein